MSVTAPAHSRAPHLRFLFDKATKPESSYTASVEPPAAMSAVTHLALSEEATTAVLVRLVTSTAVEGRLIGVDFVITARQLRAITDFARQELRLGTSS